MNKKESKADSPAGAGTISNRAEKKQVEDRLAIGANVVYETIRREGEDELHRTASALAWSAFAAGLSMGFSFIAEAVLTARLPDQPWRPLIAFVGYCVGFLIVILGRQQLFTENTLTVVLPLLVRKDLSTLLRMLRLWAVVLSANLVGTFLFALCLAKIAVVDARTQQCLIDLGKAFWIEFWHRAGARPLCRLVDCLNGVAASWRGIRASQHHHHRHLLGGNQWIRPHHRGIEQDVFSDCYRIHHLENVRLAILCTHFAR